MKVTVIFDDGSQVKFDDPTSEITSENENGLLALIKNNDKNPKLIPFAVFREARLRGVVFGEFENEYPMVQATSLQFVPSYMPSIEPAPLKSISEQTQEQANCTSTTGRHTDPMQVRAEMGKMQSELEQIVKTCGGH